MGNDITTSGESNSDEQVREIDSAAPERAGQRSEDKADSNILPMDRAAVKYDLDGLNSFISAVFHVEPVEGAEIFVQVSPNAPKGFGTTPAKLFQRLARTEAPMPAYFSTSTLMPIDGIMRHTKAAFVDYRVLVLDDIGTKIPDSKLPEDLAPNYVIESSTGNYQWGFILEKPIDDYEEAQLLINLFVDAGLTDGGGAMPVKKVRLPTGVNNKKEHDNFQVRLVGELDPKPWAVQELLDAAGINVDWKAYKTTARKPEARTRRVGISAWNPDLFYMDPHTGVFDPVLEWMFKQGMVIQEAQEGFMDVICPFHDEHSEKSLPASLLGYSPLGHGLYKNARIFHCYHGACKDRKHSDFLAEIAAMGGPECPAVEFAPADVIHYVFDDSTDRVYNLKQKGALYPMSIMAVNRTKQKVMLPNGKQAEQLNLWLKQPSAVIVSGAVHDVSTRHKLVLDEDGVLRVNVSYVPYYEPCKPDMEKVQWFLDYIDYLFPHQLERDYFTGWLACKVQNPAFRGAAIVLITQAQGTGKNTLMELLKTLFDRRNVEQINMDTLVGGGQFNEWASKLFVNVNESLATSDAATARRAYNRLKEVVDPMAMDVIINAKYGNKFLAKCATSFLFFSNHLDAVYLQDGDRRFFAASGPDAPADAAYFGAIHGKIKKGGWMQDVWNYFDALEVNEEDYMKAPPVTETMKDIKHHTTSDMEALVNGLIACWPTELVPIKLVKELVTQYVPRGIPENHAWHAGKLLTDKLTSTNRFKGAEYDCRVRGLSTGLKRASSYLMSNPEELMMDREACLNYWTTDYKEREFLDKVDAWLVDNGFDF